MTVAALPALRASRPWEALARYSPAAIVGIAVILGWEWAVRSLVIDTFALPAPSRIAGTLVSDSDSLLAAASETLLEAVGGLAIGVGTGVAAAFATARWSRLRDVVLPFGVMASAVPIIAFAPVMNNWFGVLSPLSKMMMAAVIVFFPVLINVTRGLTDVDASSLELMRSYAASDATILRRVRIPNALPYFFAALKIATTLSLIGAIVGEYFGGTDLVLGRLIVNGASSLRYDITWAAISLGAAMGIAFYLIVSALERIVIPWHASQRTRER